MQAIIMAAGKGSRLGEITRGKPKSFAQIKGNRLIDYNISLLRQHGIKKIVIVTGFSYQDFDEEYRMMPDIELVFNPFYDQVNVLGSFWVGMQHLSEDFLFIHADSLCDPDLFEEMLRTQGDIVLPVDFDTYNEEAMGVRIEDGKAVEISKEIPIGKAAGEFIGFARVSAMALSEIKEITTNLLKQKRFAEYFEAAIQGVMDVGAHSITILPTKGRFWAEIDFMEDLNKATSEIPDSLVRLVESQKRVQRSD